MEVEVNASPGEPEHKGLERQLEAFALGEADCTSTLVVAWRMEEGYLFSFALVFSLNSKKLLNR